MYICNPRANGAKAPLGESTNPPRLFTHRVNGEHSEGQRHPHYDIIMEWDGDGFRRYAQARVITAFKNMADYMKIEQLAEGS